jgi:valyl-tRNA synthetase
MDRFEVRKQILIDLQAAGLIEKAEDYTNKVGFSERTYIPIEPKLSMQWFLKMNDLAKPALDAVIDDTIRFYPAKFKNTYRHWMENVTDWCISRQLWWGHRIPAYYLPEGGYVVAESESEALWLAREKTGNPNLSAADLRQDEDCLDTWFSSWLWPISVFDGINQPDNEDINYYYPTNDLVTAPEIIFFWVARMIISGYEYRNKPCFYNVYFTGIVRDKIGQKMSKSLGNSPDPIELMEKYSADGVRMGMLLSSPAGNDLLFDESLCDQGRNFTNKIWNALRLVKGWEVSAHLPQPDSAKIAGEWFQARFDVAALQLTEELNKYRISEALMNVYKLFWDEFSSWYLELIKPAYQQPIDAVTCQEALSFFEKLVELLHPFMPFITEEVWQLLFERKSGESIMTKQLPSPRRPDESLIADFETVKLLTAGIRTIRLERNIPSREPLALHIVSGAHNERFDAVVAKIGNLERIERCAEKDATKVLFMVGTTEYAIPLAGRVDVAEERKKMEKEIIYLEGFLQAVLKKLNNEKFVANAHPDVVANERKKQQDAESKLATLRDNLSRW